MRSSPRALAALGLTLAGCAPKDAPVCQPVFSYAAPAYGCSAGAPPPAVAVEEPRPARPAPELEAPSTPTLATLGEGSIDLAEKIQFKVGSPELLPASAGLLDQVARLLLAHREITKVRIDGHTDSVGNNGKNLALSQARAESVRAYLARRGVDADRMAAKGFGETRPVGDNRTAAGRDRNRRVEITILHRGP